MKRRDFSALLATAPLAGATGLALAQGGPIEGRQYKTLAQPLPTAPGKIEVVEFFWYGCPHCYALDPSLEAWRKGLPADVAFRRVHVGFHAVARLHQRMFYALEVMGKEADVHDAIFKAFHVDRVEASDDKAVIALMGKLGLDASKFTDAYNSFGVRTKSQQATKLSESFNIDGVPALGIGGRFLTSPGMAAGGQRLNEVELGQRALAVTDFLIQRVRSKA